MQKIKTGWTALWKAIVDRYKAETQIIGFGLVNEPVPTNDIAQWQRVGATHPRCHKIR
jgi:aryl-phospho-beta-D-glucosidase BglC (GH1 family)